MRGKETEAAQIKADARITPAYAGKSSLPEVHWSMMLGSPPPMRGKECQRCNGDVHI